MKYPIKKAKWYEVKKNQIIEKAPHKVYDMSITEVSERSQKAIVFDNVIEVASFLGIRVSSVFKNREPNKYVKGLNGKLYAIRKL
jgi:hypothetical protein